MQPNIDKHRSNDLYSSIWIGASWMQYGSDYTHLALCENDAWLLYLNTPVESVVEAVYRFENIRTAKIVGPYETKEQDPTRRDKNCDSDTQFLFARKLSHNSPVQPYAGFRLYSFKISQNLKVTRDLVPVLDASGVPCMYDKVSHKTFYNQGTGEFLYG